MKTEIGDCQFVILCYIKDPRAQENLAKWHGSGDEIRPERSGSSVRF